MIAIYYQAKKLLLLTQTHGCKDALPLTRDRPQKKKKKKKNLWLYGKFSKKEQS